MAETHSRRRGARIGVMYADYIRRAQGATTLETLVEVFSKSPESIQAAMTKYQRETPGNVATLKAGRIWRVAPGKELQQRTVDTSSMSPRSAIAPGVEISDTERSEEWVMVRILQANLGVLVGELEEPHPSMMGQRLVMVRGVDFTKLP